MIDCFPLKPTNNIAMHVEIPRRIDPAAFIIDLVLDLRLA